MPVGPFGEKKAAVKYLDPQPGRRMLAVSDIHGNVDFLKGVLEKVKFSSDDLLFVVGDILEKGPRSLDTLRYLMSLSRTHDVYPICGNCDQIDLDFLAGLPGVDEALFPVFKAWGKNGLVFQMGQELGLTTDRAEDFPALRQAVADAYPDEWAYLAAMPHIIRTPRHIFVHGGIPREDRLEELDAYAVMKNDDFLGQNLAFQNWVVVGHWPVTLYNPHIPTAKPLILRDRRIVSIDGGCVLKVDGQLNCLIIPDAGSADFSYAAYDGMPVATALDDQTPSAQSLNIRWSESEVEVLKRGDELSLCRHLATGRAIWILNDYLEVRRDGKLHCEDSTDYVLPVKAGERLAVVRRTSKGSLCKKDGSTGWYLGRLEF